MTTGPAARSAASLLAAGLCATVVVPLTPPVLAMSSPWWEHYEIRESFLCRDRGRLVVERNDAQASLISGGSRATLFRETSPLPGVRYGDDNLRLILKGDELTVERLPQRFSCFRTDQA
jgi:hypothetical protein